MKCYTTITKKTYDYIIENGCLVFGSEMYDPFDGEGVRWLAHQFKTLLGIEEAVKSISYMRMEPTSAKSCRADTEWANLTLDIPKGEYLMLDMWTMGFLINSYLISNSKAEADSFTEENKKDPQFRKQNWLRVFDVSSERDVSWVGELKLAPHTYKIDKSWIVDAQFEKGKEFSKWIGDDTVDLDSYPPLEGYGDTIKIGDKFTLEQKGNREVYTLLGWDLEGSAVRVYTTTNDMESITTFNANPTPGNIKIKKVNK